MMAVTQEIPRAVQEGSSSLLVVTFSAIHGIHFIGIFA